jgi:NAD(P)-dependent dehydrogenase (short-subunit alcohol dehydrogenase family)
MADRLRDKVILVTGSTTGIGEFTARLCVAEGAYVMVHGRDEARARAVVDVLNVSAACVICFLFEL